ncbi:MAG TPA: hypothetical protein VGQ69_15940 [Gemmatimonadales bacterium]|jgi:hypothetical protein|nr:hypothetical protein [Gemmatimonadales bacterium]
MQSGRLIVIGLLACLGCSKSSNSDSGANAGAAAAAASGVEGTYTAANGDPFSFEFKPGGTVEMNGGPLGSSTGTYTVDGEKLLVTTGGRTYTFIKDGNCIEDNQQVFGKLCIGGMTGAASNVSTRSAPPTTGTWVATSSDGEFKLEFNPDNKLTLTLTTPGGQPVSKQGSFVIERDVVHATLDQSEPMVLKWVNDGYETTSFGLAMRFERR